MANAKIVRRHLLTNNDIGNVLNGALVVSLGESVSVSSRGIEAETADRHILTSGNAIVCLDCSKYCSADFSAANRYVFGADKPETEDKLLCSCCSELFQNRNDQVEHYKSDWHRLNVKRKAGGLSPVTYQSFLVMLDEDISSLSGSESTSDSDSDSFDDDGIVEKRKRLFNKIKRIDNDMDDSATSPMNDKSMINRQWVYLRNALGHLLRLNRCLLQSKKEDVSFDDLTLGVQNITQHLKWAVFMVSGGHFAAAIFDGDSMLVHKAFHHYTVRRKQGGSQSSRDNQGNAPRSAGASLRRQQETALAEDIQRLLLLWTTQLKSCDRIFMRAVGRNRAFFYSGKEAQLDKKDERIRNIPFPTRRPTMQEVQRVHLLLLTVEHIDVSSKNQEEENGRNENSCLPSTEPNCELVANLTLNDSSHIQEFERPNVEDRTEAKEKTECAEDSQSDTQVADTELRLKKGKKKKKRKDKASDNSKVQLQREEDSVTEVSVEQNLSPEDAEMQGLRNELYTACCVGDLNMLMQCLTRHGASAKSVYTHPALANSLDTIRDLHQAVVSGNTERLFAGQRVSVIGGVCLKEDAVCDDTVLTPSEAGIDSLSTCDDNQPNKPAEDAVGGGEMLAAAVAADVLVHRLINESLTPEGHTALHLAASRDHFRLIAPLLTAGADPSRTDCNGKPPYAVARNKNTRNEFRRFMALMPDKYDYSAAQIPSPLTSEQEQERKAKEAKKKSEQKKAKREKQKEAKAEELKQKQEEEEAKKFLALSDREKRALQAERRFAKQLAGSGSTTTSASSLRCWQCGADISRVPFEYNNFVFCTTTCLQKHRQLNTVRL